MIDLLLGRKIEPPSFLSADGQTILLRLDACISMGQQYRNKVSRFPVEEGLDVTDHIKQEPETLTIEGVVSNSPIAGLLFADAAPVSDYNTIVGGKDRVVTALEVLLLISGRRLVQLPDLKGDIVRQTIHGSKPVVFDLSTNLRTFTDMVIEDLSIDLDKTTGDALPFKATCVKIEKVSTKESTINYSNGKLASGIEDQTKTDDKGQQNTTDPEKAPDEPASVLKGGVKHLFDWR